MVNEKKFTIKDVTALIKMSLWPAFWKVNGAGVISVRRHPYACFFVIAIAASLIYSGFWYLSIFLFIDPLRLIHAFSYYGSTWYRNTGITPSKIVSDQGLYGEYMMTKAAAKAVRSTGASGKVYNRILVPYQGRMTEIDAVIVSEKLGIHVLEAKCRGGEFRGEADAEMWVQRIGRETYHLQNPIMQNQWHVKAIQSGLEKDTGVTLPGKILNVVLFTLPEATWSISKPLSFNAKYLVSPVNRYARSCREMSAPLEKEDYDAVVSYMDGLKASSTRAVHQEFVNEKTGKSA